MPRSHFFFNSDKGLCYLLASEKGLVLLENTKILVEREPDEWAQRSSYWLDRSEAGQPKRKRREKASAPLVLTGLNMQMRVERGTLIIRDGTTHSPQEIREYRFFKGSLDLPPRIIVLDGYGSLTLDALDWLAEQNVALIRVRWNGQFFSMLSAGGCAPDPQKYAWQVQARTDEAERLAFYMPLMKLKFQNSLETLERFFPNSTAQQRSIARLKTTLTRLRTDPPKTLKALLGLEAQAASAYFVAWQTLEIRWSKSKRYPVPESWRHFRSRSSEAVGLKGKGENVHATHPVNAMLNYVYTVLLARTQLDAIADGYDPMLGVIHTSHRSRYGQPRPSFAIDLMEPNRPLVDRVVLRLISEETFSGADFDLQSNGVVRVNPQLVRRLAGEIDSVV